MGWDDYKDCCRAVAAHDHDAVFCPECRHALFRCSAPDCRRLITPLGHCAACIDPRLSLEKGAVVKARLGECLSVPFVIGNNASVRSVSIKSVLRDGTDLPQEVVRLPWDQLEAGRARTFAVATGPFAHGGINSLKLTVIVAAVFGDVEEAYAFSGDVAIDVEGADPTQVVQTFNLSGVFANEGAVNVSPLAHVADYTGRQTDASSARNPVTLERAERYEIEHGYRGYERLAARIPRSVEFVYAGFPASDRPRDGALLQGPVVRCGRNGRAGHAPQGAEPNDLCLRIYDPASGELDREASAGISRHVCDFILGNDRLYVRSASGNGPALNGQRLDAGEMRVVCSGDSLTVAAGRGRTLALGTTFRVSSGLVTQVRIEKVEGK
jgi:hypothetical protein